MENLNIKKDITIVLVLYKETFDLVSKTLNSLKLFKIIIIDNDNNLILKKKIETKFFIDQYILNKENIGFSAGYNQGIKLSKTVYDMGMKVAAVSLMCQDDRVFQAMEMAGTPCPYMGKIGDEATLAWNDNSQERPDYKDNRKKINKRLERIEEEKEKIAEEPRKAFIDECKQSRHLSGKHEGVRKSGSTCRKEWNALDN